MTRPAKATYIRWMIRNDLLAVAAIERLCFEFPWTAGDFIRVQQQRNIIAMVAICDERIVGYVVYEIYRTYLHILNIAVMPAYQMQGVGSALIGRLQQKLNERRSQIMLEVRETNLDALLFLKARGFLAIEVFKEHYYDIDEDAYLMAYRMGTKVIA